MANSQGRSRVIAQPRISARSPAGKPLQNIIKPGIIPFIEQLLIFVEIMPVVIAFEDSFL